MGKAIVAMFCLPLVLTRKRHATTVADKAAGKGDFCPAAGAKTEIAGHAGAAADAGRRENDLKRASYSRHVPLWSRAMSDLPKLTDRRALLQNRARAMRRPDGPEMFLHRLAADEIALRLDEVNRRFTRPAIVTGFADFWRGRFPDALVVGDDEPLALHGQAHDLVIHAMALHWADDPVGQVIQCARALAPDGLFLAVLPGGSTLHELRAALAEAESRVTGGLSPRVLPMGEIRDLGALLGRAGLALAVADKVGLPASYRDLGHLAGDLRAMGEANVLAARPRGLARRAVFTEAARIYAEAYPAPDPATPGRIAATYELVFLTGWSPHESQQKPLRPGSAMARLADVLRADEDAPAGRPKDTSE